MKDLKSIFNHPPKANPENDPHLYEWKHPIHGKDDGEALNRLLNQKRKRSHLAHHQNSKTRANGSVFNKKQIIDR